MARLARRFRQRIPRTTRLETCRAVAAAAFGQPPDEVRRGEVEWAPAGAWVL